MAGAGYSYNAVPMLLLSVSVNPLERGGSLFLLQPDLKSCQGFAGVTRITAFFSTLRQCSFDPIASPLDQPSATPFCEGVEHRAVMQRSQCG
jgi:hypothetical protein